ncbi:MAG: co-chaperone GroES [Vampirovibrionales bacterium]|nr:co-chaperone GroES [Vampirovibrionales bacterium]
MSQTQTQVRIKPLGDRVVLEVLEGNQQTPGGIYIPDSAKEKPTEGRIVAVGPGRVLDNGQREPMNVEVGQRVLFARYGGSEVKIDGQEYKILSEKDILGVIQE